MVRHRRGRLQRAAVLQVSGNPGRAERMVADRRADLGRHRASAHHRERIGLGQGRSEEHTSELQSLMRISYAVFCLKKKKKQYTSKHTSPLPTPYPTPTPTHKH